jgi:hypothetical protein
VRDDPDATRDPDTTGNKRKNKIKSIIHHHIADNKIKHVSLGTRTEATMPMITDGLSDVKEK